MPGIDINWTYGYSVPQAGLEAVEASERKHREEDRTQERQLLSGSSIHDACRNGDLARVKELLDKFPEMKEYVWNLACFFKGTSLVQTHKRFKRN